MSSNAIEAILALALACARSFGEAVTRDACDALAEQAELLDVARSPIAQGVHPLNIVAELQNVEPSQLSAADRVRFLKSAVAHRAWVESRVNAALLAIAGTSRRVHVARIEGPGARLKTIEIEDAARSEIALAARWTEAHAQMRVDVARLLHRLLPTAQSVLASGEISQEHAAVIAEGASRLAAGIGVDVLASNAKFDTEAWQSLSAATAQLDTRASAIAVRSNRSHTRSAVTRIVDALDPVGMRHRREHAARDRGVWVQPEGDGNSLFMARMSTVQANACLSRVRERAQQNRVSCTLSGACDVRGIGELRAEALAEMILAASEVQQDPAPRLRGVTEGTPNTRSASNGRTAARRSATRKASTEPSEAHSGVTHAGIAAKANRRGRETRGSDAAHLRADIDVVITLDALLALQCDLFADNAILRGPSHEEALVPAAEIRDLLVAANMDVSLRRLITDPMTGHLLDASPRRYEPGERLRDFIAARDVRCRWPGCNARATGRGVDIDHATPFDSGGTTQRANLGALCRRHHLLKTHEDFEIAHSADDGSCTLTTPSGATYEHDAVSVLPTRELPELPPF